MITQLNLAGDTWKILNIGATREREGGKMTYCHLASETRGKQQKNGWYPVQMADWIEIPECQEAYALGRDIAQNGERLWKNKKVMSYLEKINLPAVEQEWIIKAIRCGYNGD